MKEIHFFWLTGSVETLIGNDPSDALNRAGYSNGALGALDFYTRNSNAKELWHWHKDEKKWVSLEFVPFILETNKKNCFCCSAMFYNMNRGNEKFNQFIDRSSDKIEIKYAGKDFIAWQFEMSNEDICAYYGNLMKKGFPIIINPDN